MNGPKRIDASPYDHASLSNASSDSFPDQESENFDRLSETISIALHKYLDAKIPSYAFEHSFQVCVVGKCSDWPAPINKSTVIAILATRKIVEAWHSDHAVFAQVDHLSSVIRKSGSKAIGANKFSWPNVFILFCTPQQQEAAEEALNSVEVFAINGPLNERNEDACDLLRRYGVENLLNEDHSKANGVSTLVMPRWSNRTETTPDRTKFRDERSFDVSNLISSGVLIANPNSLAIATAWLAMISFSIATCSIMAIVLDVLVSGLALPINLTGWLYGFFFASSLIFLIASELANIVLTALKSARPVAGGAS